MRLIDVDQLKKEWHMGDICETCSMDTRQCGNDYCFSRMDVCGMLDDAPTANGWISVKDRLPDAAGAEVLVLAHNNYYDTYVIFIAFLAYGEIKWCTYDTTKMTLERPTDNTVNERLTITHWMPMPEPEPPKEDKQND